MVPGRSFDISSKCGFSVFFSVSKLVAASTPNAVASQNEGPIALAAINCCFLKAMSGVL
jgi:hypothetical protein